MGKQKYTENIFDILQYRIGFSGIRFKLSIYIIYRVS